MFLESAGPADFFLSVAAIIAAAYRLVRRNRRNSVGDPCWLRGFRRDTGYFALQALVYGASFQFRVNELGLIGVGGGGDQEQECEDCREL